MHGLRKKITPPIQRGLEKNKRIQPALVRRVVDASGRVRASEPESRCFICVPRSCASSLQASGVPRQDCASVLDSPGSFGSQAWSWMREADLTGLTWLFRF